MAELDYAFVAEYARVDPTGTLTAVGASPMRLGVAALPGTLLVYVAGRAFLEPGEAARLELEVKGPSNLSMHSTLPTSPAAQAASTRASLSVLARLLNKSPRKLRPSPKRET